MPKNLEPRWPTVTVRLGDLAPLVREAMSRQHYRTISDLVHDAVRWRLEGAPIGHKTMQRLVDLADFLEVLPEHALQLLLDRYGAQLKRPAK